MDPDHLAHVHPVDVVGPENRDEIGLMNSQKVDALVDGIGGTAKIHIVIQPLGRHDGYKLIRQQLGDAPGLAHMFDE